MSIAKAKAAKAIFKRRKRRRKKRSDLVETIRARVNVGDLRDSFSANLQDFYGFYVELLMRRQSMKAAKILPRSLSRPMNADRARGLLNLLSESNVNIREGVEPKLLQKELELKNLLSARLENLTKILGGKPKSEELLN